MSAQFGGESLPVGIVVCQAGSCRRAGSKVVLLEIEELAKTIGKCTVRPTGCIGACRQAPNAEVRKGQKKVLCSRLTNIQKSAAVVQKATGKSPNLDDAVLVQRLTDARQRFMAEPWRSKQDKRNAARQSASSSSISQAIATPAMTTASASSPNTLTGLIGQVAKKCWGKAKRSSQDTASDALRPRMDKYAKWRLDKLTKVSKHSAIFHFSSTDQSRSTPNPRGRWRSVSAITWHTTLLANVGANSEGSSPWIERDYTPISSWKEWELGRCDILIKVYHKGLATSWLHKKQPGSEILLSQPIKTLDVPSLVPDLGEAAFKSDASVLLILAGTGIVVASQVLHHADRTTSFGPTPAMTSPVSLIYSCRKDDVLMMEELMGWCDAGKLERCTLTLTKPEAGMAPPFPDIEDTDLNELASLTNARVISSRLSQDILASELRLLKKPCRVVVSGPAPFNSAVKDMLSQSGIDPEAITMLSA